MQRVIGVMMATLIVVGCSAPAAERGGSASPVPAPSAVTKPPASAGPTPVATADATPMATPLVTLAPAPAQEFEIDWTGDDPIGLPKLLPE